MSPVTSSGLVAEIALSATLAPAAQHDDSIGHREHVGHAVADQHDGDSLVAQPAHEIQHFGHLAHRYRRRRLVHQDDLRIGQPGTGDRHRLTLAAGHVANDIARPRLRFQLDEQLGGAPAHRLEIENAQRPDPARELPAHEDVDGGRQVVAERQILIDDLDAAAGGPRRPRERGRAAIDKQLAGRGREVAGHDLDEGRLAGAVVPHQTDHFAGRDRQRDIIERVNGAEVLRYGLGIPRSAWPAPVTMISEFAAGESS